MVTKEEREKILGELVIHLGEVQRFTKQDIANKYPMDSRDLGLLIWEATEAVFKSEGIVFGPVRGWPGTLERKEWDQIEARAQRQRRRGTRAHKRAEARLRQAATLAPDDAKERLNNAADRVALRIAMRAARA